MCRVIVILLLSILCRSVFAEKNFWGNDICFTDGDCSGLTTCDPTFGCTTSFWKVALVVVGVFIGIVIIMMVVTFFCIRTLWNKIFRRRNNHFTAQTIITTTNTTASNQPQMGAAPTSNVYPYQSNPNPNQPYANAVPNQPYPPYPNAVPNQPYPSMVPNQPYPNTVPNQPYPNSVDLPPPYNPYVADVRVGNPVGMNTNQMPSAPYSPSDYAQESQTHHSKY